MITTPVSSSYYFYFIRNIVPYSLSAFFFEKLIEIIDNNSLKYGRNHNFLEKKKILLADFTHSATIEFQSCLNRLRDIGCCSNDLADNNRENTVSDIWGKIIYIFKARSPLK